MCASQQTRESECSSSGQSSELELSSAVGSLYSILGLPIQASADEIRVAYLQLARLWHPDRHQGKTDAKRKFQEIQCAYEVLRNPRRRQHYDLGLLDLLNVEDYLSRFQDFVLSPMGLSMTLRSSSEAMASAQQQQPSVRRSLAAAYQFPGCLPKRGLLTAA